MDLQVTSGVIATLLEEAARAAPEECCGLLLGRDGVESTQGSEPSGRAYLTGHGFACEALVATL